MAESILIATGLLLVALDLGTAFAFDPQAALLGAMGAYILMQVTSLIEESRALEREDR